ncbi:energy transducer TonB [Hymenobacter properus]|uniref:TonB C-terminal domain-containing protein n=1 Tax=Hymenobacter properus TaxID=2791026 RepID=A0A931FHZ1_9BACT|nr:hypothetical protein [Hymenobacter properus]MBF9140218.1 hypothetical protein [Hymenobacter properus]MBR7719025.1 hypothetical protein [Microvirga sp. SRT04]
MRRSVVCSLLVALGLGLAHAGGAQQSSGPPLRAKSRKPTGRLTPPAQAGPVGALPLLPRYWQLTDSTERTDATDVFSQYLQHFISYPALALRAGVGGAIYARLTVRPDGRVESIAITRRDLSTDAPPAKAVMALDAELQRVAWQLHFKPAAARIDSSAINLTTSADTLATPVAQSDSTEVSIYVQDDDAGPMMLADTVTIVHRFVPPSGTAAATP